MGSFGDSRPPEVIAQLKNEIETLRLSNYDNEAIAQKLGLPRTTYYRYLKAMRKEWAENELQNRDQILFDYWRARKEEISEARSEWLKHRNPTMLRVLVDATEFMMMRLERLGYLPSAKDIKLQLEENSAIEKAWKEVVYGDSTPIESRSKDSIPKPSDVL